jgi:hypothetical protein
MHTLFQKSKHCYAPSVTNYNIYSVCRNSMCPFLFCGFMVSLILCDPPCLYNVLLNSLLPYVLWHNIKAFGISCCVCFITFITPTLTLLLHDNVIHAFRPFTQVFVIHILLNPFLRGAWSIILLGRLIVTQIVKKLPGFCGTHRSITMSTRTHCWSLSPTR